MRYAILLLLLSSITGNKLIAQEKADSMIRTRHSPFTEILGASRSVISINEEIRFFDLNKNLFVTARLGLGYTPGYFVGKEERYIKPKLGLPFTSSLYYGNTKYQAFFSLGYNLLIGQKWIDSSNGSKYQNVKFESSMLFCLGMRIVIAKTTTFSFCPVFIITDHPEYRYKTDFSLSLGYIPYRLKSKYKNIENATKPWVYLKPYWGK